MITQQPQTGLISRFFRQAENRLKNHKGCINNLSHYFLVVYFLTSQALPFKTKQRILLKKTFLTVILQIEVAIYVCK